MYLLILWCCVRKQVSSWSSYFLLTVLFRWSNLILVYFFGFSLYRHQYVCYFHSRNKIFCFALKRVTDSFHYSASQRILVAAILLYSSKTHVNSSLLFDQFIGNIQDIIDIERLF